MKSMQVIPKQEAFDAYEFIDLEQMAEVVRFVRGADDGGKAMATVQIDGNGLALTVSTPLQTITVNRYEWLVRKGDAVEVLTREQMTATYQQARLNDVRAHPFIAHNY